MTGLPHGAAQFARPRRPRRRVDLGDGGHEKGRGKPHPFWMILVLTLTRETCPPAQPAGRSPSAAACPAVQPGGGTIAAQAVAPWYMP